MTQRIDLVRNSLPAQGQLILEAAEETANGIVFRVRVKEPPRCPACLKSRVSYHSRYVRRMRDLFALAQALDSAGRIVLLSIVN